MKRVFKIKIIKKYDKNVSCKTIRQNTHKKFINKKKIYVVLYELENYKLECVIELNFDNWLIKFAL